MRHPAHFALLATFAGAFLAAPSLGAQAASKVDYTPETPPNATWPIFVDVAPSMVTGGTAFDNQGSGRGQAWIDLVGPDPSAPGTDLTGPPDGVLDLVQINSNSPGLPLGAGAGSWLVPPVGSQQHPCVVYRGNPDGTFTDVTERLTPERPDGFGMDYPGGSPWGAVGADYDGDGTVDLFVPCGGFNTESPNALFQNDGDGTLTNVTASAGLGLVQPTFGACWLDFDRDGDLDLFETNAGAAWPEFFQGSSSPDATDRLFRNEGDGTFVDVGVSAGVDLRSNGFSCASSDLDRNGWPDLVVSCFRQFNKLFYNNGDGSFSFMAPARSSTYDLDIDADMAPDAAFPGTEDLVGLDAGAELRLPMLPDWSMPVQLEDMNADGWTDVLYTAWSMQLPDGNATSAENALFSPWDPARLYLNRGDQDGDGIGDGLFREVAVDVGIAHVGGAMGLATADFNGDGFLDAYVGCGGPQVDAHLEEDYLYINDGSAWPKDFQVDPDQPLGQVFYEVGALAGTYPNIDMAHGVTVGHGENGRLDVLLGNGGPAVFDDGQPNAYFHNTGNADGGRPSYFRVGTQVERSALYGARVELLRTPGTSGPASIVRERRSGEAFASHNDGDLFFGLGDGAPLWVGADWTDGTSSGELLWPQTAVTGTTLTESELSIGLDIATDVATGVSTLTVRLENLDTTPEPLFLGYVILGVDAVGEPELLEAVAVDDVVLAPSTPLSLAGHSAHLPQGLHAIVAVDASLQVIGSGAVWHDPEAAGLAGLPPGGQLAQAVPGAPGTEPGTDPGTETDTAAPRLGLARAHVAVGATLRAVADELWLARAQSPIEWRRYDLSIPGQLTLESGDRVAWLDGALQFVLEDGTPAPVSFNDGFVLLTTGRPSGCCDTRPIDQGQLLRFEGLERLSIDGVAYTAGGQPILD